MKGPFDNFLKEAAGDWEGTRQAAIEVNDTLYVARLIAEQIFGDDTSPEIALAIYDRILRREESA